MLIFKCDTCDRTGYATQSVHNQSKVPIGWLTFDGNFSIENQIKEVKRNAIYSGRNESGLHFCSKKCFVGFFFQEENEKEQSNDKI